MLLTGPAQAALPNTEGLTCVLGRATIEHEPPATLEALVTEAARSGCARLWLPPLAPARDRARLLPVGPEVVVPELADATRAVLRAAHGVKLEVLGSLMVGHVDREHPWAASAEAGDAVAASMFAEVPGPDGAPERVVVERGGRPALALAFGAPVVRGRLARATEQLVAMSMSGVVWIGAGREPDALAPDALRGQVMAPSALAGTPRRGARAEVAAPVDAANAARHLVRGARGLGLVAAPGTSTSSLGLEDLTRALGRESALWVGRRTLLQVEPADAGEAAWVEDGAARFVVARIERAPLKIALPPRESGQGALLFPASASARTEGSRLVLDAPSPTLAVWRVAAEPASNRIVRFVGPETPSLGATHLDQGLAFDPARGHGLERTEASVARDGVLRFSASGGAWSLAVPPGPYAVEVRLAAPLPREDGGLRLEGRALEPARDRRSLALAVFVRDGRLSLRPAGAGSAALVTEVRVRPLEPRALSGRARVERGVVQLEAPRAGVVEWRMDDSLAEPAEETPLVKRGAVWVAELGPFPRGVAARVSWVLRSGAEFGAAEETVELRW